MKTRVAIAAVAVCAGSLAVSGSSAFAADPAKFVRIGLLDASKPLPKRRKNWGGFEQRMHELGYIEGRNIAYERRWGNSARERLPGLARELVSAKVDVIVTAATPAAFAARRATSTIPIVMALASGSAVVPSLVKTLPRPGGNVTGVMSYGQLLTAKRLELAKEIVPSASRMAILGAKTHAGFAPAVQASRAGAAALGVSLLTVGVNGVDDLDGAIADMQRSRIQAFVVAPSAIMSASRLRIAELAAKARIPGILPERYYAEVGGFVSYGSDQIEMFRQAAIFVDKILKGANPAELPAERATRFELVVNLMAARALGISVPRTVLLRADRIIE